MKYHARMLERRDDGSIVEALGTDAVHILDGRNTVDNMEVDARDYLARYNKYIHNYCGFRIMKGERFDNSVMLREILVD